MDVEQTAPVSAGVPVSPNASRRTVLVAGTAGAVAALTGCTVYGRDDPGAADAADSPDPADDDSPDSAGDGGDGVASAADIEVGGGLVIAEHDLVVTQPTSGVFRGFSATCTHQGCAIASVSDGTINCPCHGSRFSVEDGSVVEAAAGLTPEQQAPLPEVEIAVDGDTIRVA